MQKRYLIEHAARSAMNIGQLSRHECSVAHLEPLQLVLEFWYNREIIPLYDSFQAFYPFILV